jgi:hypothetical protein
MPDCMVQLGGSYRRGSSSSSDLDMLLSVPGKKTTMDLMVPLFARLCNDGILVGHISDVTALMPGPSPAARGGVEAESSEEEGGARDGGGGGGRGAGKGKGLSKAGKGRRGKGGKGGSTFKAAAAAAEAEPSNHHKQQRFHLYMGFARHRELTGGITRRIDIRVMDSSSQPSSLFGWTGNTQFNRALKRFSNNLCFEFSESNMLPTVGARDSTMDSKSTVSSHWVEPKDQWLQEARGAELECEFDIFSFFGLRYVPPHERNVLAVLDDDGEAKQQSNKSAGKVDELKSGSGGRDDDDAEGENAAGRDEEDFLADVADFGGSSGGGASDGGGGGGGGGGGALGRGAGGDSEDDDE